MNIPQQIKITRKILKETQEEFGKRFDVNSNTVSRWETGVNEAPYEVVSFVVGKDADKYEWEMCSCCNGKGYISKKI